MSEERDEGPITTEEMDSSFEQIEGVPISIDVTDNQDAIGEVSVTEPQEEKVQEQKLQSREGVQEESRIGKGKQKRRITS